MEGTPPRAGRPNAPIACTVATRSRLAHARVLARSFLTHHPGGRLFTLVVDDREHAVAGEPFEVLRPEDLALESVEFLRQAAMYDPIGLSCALKPHLIRNLLDAGNGPILYLDTDILVCAPLDPLFELARIHSLVLIPHEMVPSPSFGVEEYGNLRNGTFNAGCIPISAAARPFLEWWSDRVARHSVNFERFMHDQPWLNLAAGYFDHAVLHEREYNIGYHRDVNRLLTWVDGHYLVDGKPLRTFHFGGALDPDRPWRPLPWIAPLPADSAVARITREYGQALLDAGYRRCARFVYGYDRAPDGGRLDGSLRNAYRDALLRFELEDGPEPPNPLVAGRADFVAWQAMLRHQEPPLSTPSGPRLTWEGPQNLAFGMAIVNHKLCRELSSRGDLDVSVVASNQPETPSVPATTSRADVHVRHEWPPRFEPPDARRFVLMQPWEFGAVPREWIAPINDLVDELWVPTTYVRDCFIGSGIRPEKVVVVSNGVDPTRFRPDIPPLPLPTRKRFRFLFVGGTIPRKGADILLETYLEAFGPDDDVCLVIKDLGVDTFYRGQGLGDRIREAQLDPAAPEILYYDRPLEYYDAAFESPLMAALYTACDCLVHPYRGEGFALPVAEAMACGLPVIVTGAGACLDFCDDSVAYLVPAQSVELPPMVGGMATAGPVRMAEVDRGALAAAMRRVFEHQEEARGIGRRASERIRTRVTWSQSAEVVSQRVRTLVARRRTLSVCMIVRNEEALLPRALASVQEVAHQLVVLDTGSTDATREIARSFGAEVYEHPWEGDFATARNLSLQPATGDWILVLDGDQEVDPGSFAELRQLVDGCAPRAYVLRQFNHLERNGAPEVLEHLALRLFRNLPGVHFKGAVHEQLVCDRPDVRFEIHMSGIVLHHHGYRPEYVDPVTLARDLAALETAVSAEPGEPFHAFNLGNTYRALGRVPDAEHELLRAVALSAPGLAGGRYPHFLVGAYLSLAELRLQQGEPAAAAAFCERAIALRPDFPDVHLAHGTALARLGRLAEAESAYERAIASGMAAAHSPTDQSASGWRAQLGLAEVLALQGRRKEAADRLAAAKVAAPSHPLVQAVGARLER